MAVKKQPPKSKVKSHLRGGKAAPSKKTIYNKAPNKPAMPARKRVVGKKVSFKKK